ncbi:MAG: hypothetical protein KAK00_06355 [Nanoarchaeota archaeon]|nr:hypothetical protein [Nanoarchaeota archaeon]
MGFLNKLAFWKKEDDLGIDKGFNSDMKGMDFGAPNDFGSSNDLSLSSSKGMPDVSNFRGVGDVQEQQQMNQTLAQPFSSSPSPAFNSPQNFQQPKSTNDLELISAKLDAIKATMDAINQRIANLERAAYPEENQNRNRW